MKISFIILTVIAVLTLSLSACGASPGTATATGLASGKGYVNILVTDAPPKNEVTSIMVTVSGISIHMAETAPAVSTTPEDNTSTTASPPTTITPSETTAPATSESDDDGGQWIVIPISGPNPFDLLKLQGIDELLGTAELQAGRYTQIRLEISKIEVVLGGGTLQEASVPSGELKFVRPFDVIAGETTDIELDFDVQKSVNITGSGKVMVKPVVKLTITNKSSGLLTTLSGAVSAVDAQAYTISILPTAQTQPVVLKITPQTVIILDETEMTLAALAALPPGFMVTVSYYADSLKAIRIEANTVFLDETST